MLKSYIRAPPTISGIYISDKGSSWYGPSSLVTTQYTCKNTIICKERNGKGHNMVYFWSLLSNIYTMYNSTINHTDYHSHLPASLIIILIHHHLSTHKYHSADRAAHSTHVPVFSGLIHAISPDTARDRTEISGP